MDQNCLKVGGPGIGAAHNGKKSGWAVRLCGRDFFISVQFPFTF